MSKKKCRVSAHAALLVVFVGFTSLCLTACGKPLSSYESQKRNAPQSSQDVGVLVSQTSEKELASVLAKNPQAQYRVLDPTDGFYEIFNVELGELKEQIKGQVSANLWIPKEESAKPDLLSTLKSQLASGISLSSTVGDGLALDRCLRDSAAPRAKIQVLSPSGGLSPTRPIEVGAEIELFAEAEAHPLYPGPMTTAFAVVTPEGNKETDIVSFGERLKFKAEGMGLYEIVLIAQDNRDVCTMIQIFAFATANTPFVGNDADISPALSRFKLEDFSHLQPIKASEAWDLGDGDGITIAVIDSGVNYNHPALLQNIAVNSKEIPGNGIDDDGNGFVDDYVGYDFSNADPHPFDDNGHGSHVAGLAASSFFGVAKKAKILPIKSVGVSGQDMASVAAGIRYAVNRGAQIINLSLGTYSEAPSELVRAINYAEAEQVLLVAAAGNGHPFFGNGINTDITPNYPSSLPNSNIIAVAASSKAHSLAPYSNFGKTSVDIVAPGGLEPVDMINSCYFETPRGDEYYGMAGTSMATPLVAGTAALVWSLNPALTMPQVRDLVLNSGDKAEAELKDIVSTARRLNVKAAAEKALSTR